MSLQRYSNSDARVVIGNFPWYEMVWRSLRGDFKPKAEPLGGYEAFARAWSQPVDHARIAQHQVQPVITWLGHVSMLLQVGDLNILLDPTLAPCAGPYGRMGAPRRVPAPLTPEELPPIDVVLISHNHYDHLCDATIGRLIASGQKPRFFVPQGLKAWFEGLANSFAAASWVGSEQWFSGLLRRMSGPCGGWRRGRAWSAHGHPP